MKVRIRGRPLKARRRYLRATLEPGPDPYTRVIVRASCSWLTRLGTDSDWFAQELDQMGLLGWVIAFIVFLVGASIAYPKVGLGGALLIGGLMALFYVARAANRGGGAKVKPNTITLSAYGTESLRNLIASFVRDRRRDPTDREAQGLARAAAFMQRSHENPSAEVDSDAVSDLFRGLYRHDPSLDEETTFAVMVANAYPKQVGTRGNDPEIVAAAQRFGAVQTALVEAEAGVANDPTACHARTPADMLCELPAGHAGDHGHSDPTSFSTNLTVRW